MTPDEIIAVVTAYKDGNQIEKRRVGKALWEPSTRPSWDFANFQYRVKKTPREFWIQKAWNEFYTHTDDPRKRYPGSAHGEEVIHVREVME